MASDEDLEGSGRAGVVDLRLRTLNAVRQEVEEGEGG